MSPRNASDVLLQADQDLQAPATAGRRRLMHEGSAAELAKGAHPNSSDVARKGLAVVAGRDDDLRVSLSVPDEPVAAAADRSSRLSAEDPMPAEDMPPRLPDTAAGDAPAMATVTGDPAVPGAAATAAPPAPAPRPHEVTAAARDPAAIDRAPATSTSTKFVDTAGDCGYGGGPVAAATAQRDLPAAASAAASNLTCLASRTASRGVAGALQTAAAQLTSAFRLVPAAGAPAGDGAAAVHGLLTQTPSGHLAAVPSGDLDLRPHTGRMGSDQRLLAAALASVGSVARVVATRGSAAPSEPGGGNEDEVERALTSAATALESAMEEIAAAATDIARSPAAIPVRQDGPGLAGLGDDKFPGGAAPLADAEDEEEEEGGDERPLDPYADMYPDAQDPSAPGGGGDVPAADFLAGGRIPTGFHLELRATSAAIVPDVEPPSPPITPPAASASTSAEGAVGGVAVGSRYVYDKPYGSASPPAAAGVGGFAGMADWAWDDPELEAPAAPADGSLVPDSAVTDRDAAIIAAADAIPSIVRDAADPATSPPGAAAGAAVTSPTHSAGAASVVSAFQGPHLAPIRTHVSSGGGGDATAASAGEAVPEQPLSPSARMPDMPDNVEELGLAATAEVTAAALAAIAPPSYVTPMPHKLLDILREPSARDLSPSFAHAHLGSYFAGGGL
ncbi:hypothetical protein GPECTOR_427g294 [Gonium pectorale]|uniref:Uncharacterized protein n=1 Tax=Gonium pectorale TaxID=33097 RepID=A0A150FWT2_GONPE|nr:hypothetical protein GPECTOR_427g294 [Gonium pectorale]|eukprot:KXZ41500.1 hypothetical protein GPECTOR_427g294 [Gonium pectorale]